MDIESHDGVLPELTNPTKMSSSELWVVFKSLKAIPKSESL